MLKASVPRRFVFSMDEWGDAVGRSSEPSVMTITGESETLEKAKALLEQTGISGVGQVFPMAHFQNEGGASCEHGPYRQLFTTSRDGIMFTDLCGRIQDANPALQMLLGYSRDELCNMFEQQLTPEKWRRLDAAMVMQALLEKEEHSEYEKEYITCGGKRVPVAVRSWLVKDESGEPYQKLTFVRDTSLYKSLEDQLRQAQKMEALGTLASGIAHDFNNVLAAILGYIELARFDVGEENPARKSIDQIYKASNRARNLVSHILAFCRPSEQYKTPVFMQQIINESLEMLRATLPSSIEIRQSMTTKHFTIEADTTQVHQILMNLCTNASHAMGEGGELFISLDVASYSELEMDGFHDVEPCKYMRLTVQDTGSGMSPEVKKRIFDPYFTTKEKGQGSGMGLAVVHGIVKAHQGFIRVESREGEGSSFAIYFPVSDQQAGWEGDVYEEPDHGSERILFVDDEPALAELGWAMLKRLGYNVRAFSDSEEALEHFKENPFAYDVVISDLTMPKLTGVAFVRELRVLRSDIPIIVCTGYSESLSADEISSAGIDFLLMKPIEIRELAASIRNALTLRCDDAAPARARA